MTQFFHLCDNKCFLKKFSSDYSKAFKTNEGNEFITIQFQKQTFNYSEKAEKDTIDIYVYIILAVVAVLVFVIVVVMKKQCKSMKLEKNNLL